MRYVNLTWPFYTISEYPTIIIMLVAIAAAKAEVFANQSFWEMVHRKGGGYWSLDSKLFKDKK